MIKEKHWFGMHEYYGNNPLLGISENEIDAYITNAAFRTTQDNNFEGWTIEHSENQYYGIGNGHIGTNSITLGSTSDENLRTFTSTTDETHTTSDWCVLVEARWQGSYASYTQETTRKLPTGTYRLTYDVQNVNSESNNSTNLYNNLFFVQVGETTYSDESWNQSSSSWTTHTIEFTITGSEQKATISLGYGLIYDVGHTVTPALFVSHLKLEQLSGEGLSKINWSGNYIESITVVKDWTGQDPLQRPNTSFCSWLDHSKLRFSVNVPGNWEINKTTNATYDGVGLYNKSTGATNFWIHDLKGGDQFNIEYYRKSGDTNVPFLVSGNVTGLKAGNTVITEDETNVIQGANANGLVYYTASSAGNVEINIPSGTVIRSVTIIHAAYQKATSSVTRMTAEEEEQYGGIGYRYTLTGAGVLEDKRGAVPYITMRF